MDCNGCYVLRSRRFVGIADAGFEDAADGLSELGDTMSLPHKHKQKTKGVEESMEMEKQDLSWKSSMLHSMDDDFLLPEASKLHASTSEGSALSGKMGLSESRTDRPSNGTSKVPRLGSMLGAASMSGFGKAVEILDTLGCLMTTLSPDGGFISRAKTKGCKISILAFEVANTILKGASVMQSLSEETVTYFKQVVLPSEGVQSLISDDMSELMRIAANDKREELKIFSQEIVRFGNRCKDPQWHNLDRYFVKLESENAPQKQLKETAIAEVQKLMTLVQRTTDLYHELHALDRFEQEYSLKLKGKENSVRFEKGDNIQIVRLELKTQRSYVKSLKKRSLWSKTLEEVVEKLVDIVHYIHVEINNTFGSSGTSMAQCLLLDQSNIVPADPRNVLIDGDALSAKSMVNCQRLGPAGLALHYANIIIQIYSIVSRSGYVPASTRDALYQGLPPRVRSALPNRLRTSSVPRELTIDQIRATMEKTLKWLVPMAINTTCARGFLRFSEWAKAGTERVGRRPGQAVPIETLYHADKARTEDYILELVVWLHHLVSQSNRPANAIMQRPMTNLSNQNDQAISCYPERANTDLF
ncbi:protein PSK SIMULATOR 1-like isoform X2 [Phragmites australis]|uniref:protein PSK SIMULATOR 1-like isoform X2 n=1 Tax=Phragmites australis TaxID=29695 RepID=UPI002D77B8ED|nr:protein PSK SIMULATOR 1-like isoform X2 [Phragmites australis]